MATNVILKLGAFFLGAALVWICLRVFGARLHLGSCFAVYTHWFAIGLLIFSFLLALDATGLRLWKPEVFAEVRLATSSGQDTQKLKRLLGAEGAYALKALLETDQDWRAVVDSPGVLWIAGMAGLRAGFALAWLAVAWRAFGKLAGMARGAAIRSLILFLTLTLFAALLAGFVQMAPIMVDTGRWLQKWSY